MKKDLGPEIKKAAQQIFVKKGIDAISMRKIAAKIKYSPTTIYIYYKNKDELIRDILHDYHRALGEKLTNVICNDAEVLTKLREFLLLYIRQSFENPEIYKLLISFRYKMRDNERGNEESSNYIILKGFVSHLIESGEFEEFEPDYIARSLWFHSYGLSTMAVYKPLGIKGEIMDFIEFSLDKIIESYRRKK